MGIQIDISDKDVQYLNAPAQHELKKHVELYIDQLLEEASRLEAGQRTADGDPQINSSMVNDAANIIKRGYRNIKKPAWLTASQIISSLSALFVGLIFDFERLKNPVMLVVFVILLAVAITFNVIVLIRDRT
jgi:hypothetical protein